MKKGQQFTQYYRMDKQLSLPQSTVVFSTQITDPTGSFEERYPVRGFSNER